MITALALMIAVAGYLNFAGTQAGQEQLASADVSDTQEDMAALLDLSEEDIVSDLEDASIDIESLDSDQEADAVENYLDESMADSVFTGDTDAAASAEAASDTAAAEDLPVSAQAELAVSAEAADEAGEELAQAESGVSDGSIPGEAVFTSSSGVSSLAGAKLQKEQTRARNKETLLDIINNESISEEQKQDAINGMINLTDMAEKETAAEILLEAKGFSDVVVSISGASVDVVVNASSLTDAQRAQIEDIVTRKTGIAPENIIISPVSGG
ncbi:MAG TPA: SpoIIIAH-like family protein [Candidatus Eisenbergiella stercorigallinarum]|uniref:SpoIIIAH-like family protein n=1 Tax=Candidatus Eisenbergiella stercorigallinarum TaxID=2838557 RepID=A0A9D2QYU7_9FIRM|nr:SpoIIIAH-like family protein [Candidatus Eisenbergiella stercorigallinarum]